MKHRSGARQQLISQNSYLNGQQISVNRVTSSRTQPRVRANESSVPREPCTVQDNGQHVICVEHPK